MEAEHTKISILTQNRLSKIQKVIKVKLINKQRNKVPLNKNMNLEKNIEHNMVKKVIGILTQIIINILKKMRAKVQQNLVKVVVQLNLLAEVLLRGQKVQVENNTLYKFFRFHFQLG